MRVGDVFECNGVPVKYTANVEINGETYFEVNPVNPQHSLDNRWLLTYLELVEQTDY